MNNPITLTPCPFCGGPPVPIVAHSGKQGALPEQAEYELAGDGLPAEAYVFCHECGADGPSAEGWIATFADFLLLEAEGVALWQSRTSENSDLINPELCLYPRDDHTEARRKAGLIP